MNKNTPKKKSVVDDKTILVTGGTGSFGKRFIKRILQHHQPKAVRVISRDEYKQHVMKQEIHDDRLRLILGDIRDREQLFRAMQGVDIVVHTAALKHVPFCENNPYEAILTNVQGGQNIIDAALTHGVEKVLALSTDKAVSPVNLYGATKLCAEKLFVQANSFVGDRKTRFSCTRYGNVVGSRGSVVPLFLAKRGESELPVTDERMTRFWITLDQGVDFVLMALENMHGGEIFVPRIPSTKITDLAKAIAPKAKVKIIGIRPGEKLHEDLLTANEAAHSKEYDDYFVIEPEFVFWRHSTAPGGKPLAEGFHYSSDNNTWWLNSEEIKSIISEFEANPVI